MVEFSMKLDEIDQLPEDQKRMALLAFARVIVANDAYRDRRHLYEPFYKIAGRLNVHFEPDILLALVHLDPKSGKDRTGVSGCLTPHDVSVLLRDYH